MHDRHATRTLGRQSIGPTLRSHQAIDRPQSGFGDARSPVAPARSAEGFRVRCLWEGLADRGHSFGLTRTFTFLLSPGNAGLGLHLDNVLPWNISYSGLPFN